ncbi:MAG: hypothetical protein IPO09_04560 [Anaeromyxobacter sp.]|nr:hypothetical protein [Anaeromyxobacter sp.]
MSARRVSKPAGEPAPAGAAPAPSGARLWAFRLLTSLLVPALLFGLLEGGLRLLGVGFPAGFTVPCQVEGRAGACDNPDFARRFFPAGLARSATPFAVTLEKGPRTFRVVVLGESAAQGDPAPPYGFARHLEVLLSAELPGLQVEVVNAGVVAINSHVLRVIAKDVVALSPDLVVVYAGNNEVVGPFGPGTVLTTGQPGLAAIRASVALGATRLGQVAARALRREGQGQPAAWRGMELFLERQVPADSPALEGVYRAFRQNLADVLATARGAGARVVVTTVPTRLVGCAPFGSAHRAGLTPAELAAFDAAVALGDAAAAAGRAEQARPRWLEAEALDPGHAALQYRLGRLALARGDAAEARTRLERARDLDTLRFRADGREETILREVAAEAGPGVTLVDGAAAVGAGSPAGLAGGEVLWEHVHLAPHGAWLLAKALLPAALAAVPAALRAVAAGPTGAPPVSLDEGTVSARLALTGFDRYRVAKEVLDRLSRAPFTGQLDHAEHLAEVARVRDLGAAEPFEVTEAGYRAALVVRPHDPWLHLARGVLLDDHDVFLARRGGRDDGRAVASYRAALERLPRLTEARFRLAESLLRLRKAGEAAEECRALLAVRPGHAAAERTLGQALAAAGRAEEAEAALRRAVALDPAAPTGRGAALDLGRLLAGAGRLEAAVAALAPAAPGGEPFEVAAAHYLRGVALGKLGRGAESKAAVEAAAQAYLAATAAHPESAEAWHGLGKTRADLGDAAGAVAPLSRAMALQPLLAEARLRLVRALAAAGQGAEAVAQARQAADDLRRAGREQDALVFDAERRALEAPAAR